MPVDARRLIRKMRGGAQAHLIEAADGHCYVVKFLNNPQHRRILVNEWIASVFLRYLGISTPRSGGDPRHAGVPGRESRKCTSNWDRGASRSNWAGTSVRDSPAIRRGWWSTIFCPMRCWRKWRIVRSFWGCWRSINGWATPTRARPSSSAHACASGCRRMKRIRSAWDSWRRWWTTDSPSTVRIGALAIPRCKVCISGQGVYQSVRGLDDFQPWLDRIVHFPEAVVDQALKQIPAAWVVGDEDSLSQLCENLLRRRKRVADLIHACRHGRSALFPGWH